MSQVSWPQVLPPILDMPLEVLGKICFCLQPVEMDALLSTCTSLNGRRITIINEAEHECRTACRIDLQRILGVVQVQLTLLEQGVEELGPEAVSTLREELWALADQAELGPEAVSTLREELWALATGGLPFLEPVLMPRALLSSDRIRTLYRNNPLLQSAITSELSSGEDSDTESSVSLTDRFFMDLVITLDPQTLRAKIEPFLPIEELMHSSHTIDQIYEEVFHRLGILCKNIPKYLQPRLFPLIYLGTMWEAAQYFLDNRFDNRNLILRAKTYLEQGQMHLARAYMNRIANGLAYLNSIANDPVRTVAISRLRGQDRIQEALIRLLWVLPPLERVRFLSQLIQTTGNPTHCLALATILFKTLNNFQFPQQSFIRQLYSTIVQKFSVWTSLTATHHALDSLSSLACVAVASKNWDFIPYLNPVAQTIIGHRQQHFQSTVRLAICNAASQEDRNKIIDSMPQSMQEGLYELCQVRLRIDVERAIQEHPESALPIVQQVQDFQHRDDSLSQLALQLLQRSSHYTLDQIYDLMIAPISSPLQRNSALTRFALAAIEQERWDLIQRLADQLFTQCGTRQSLALDVAIETRCNAAIREQNYAQAQTIIDSLPNHSHLKTELQCQLDTARMPPRLKDLARPAAATHEKRDAKRSKGNA